MAFSPLKRGRRRRARPLMLILLAAFAVFSLHKLLQQADLETKEPVIIVYSLSRQDRPGAFLQDLLFAHAFAFSNNFTFGGCCETSEFPAKHKAAITRLIESLGLQQELKFACPDKQDDSHLLLKRKEYYKQDTLVWNDKWLSFIRSKVKFNESSTFKPPPIMAVHVRRGDVTPCPDQDGRYLPNKHYLRLIQKYRPSPDTPVHVYSETNSSESWNYFNDTHIHLELDTPLEQVFLSMAQAETLIMSKSSFSLVAAMLNPNRIIYTPFWHKPLPLWTVVSPDVMTETTMELQRLRRLDGC